MRGKRSRGRWLSSSKNTIHSFSKKTLPEPARWAWRSSVDVILGADAFPPYGRGTRNGGSRSLSFLRSIEAQAASSFPTRSTSSCSLVLRNLSFFSVLTSTSPRFSYTASPSVPHTRAPNAVATTTASSCDRVGSLEIAWSATDSNTRESTADQIQIHAVVTDSNTLAAVDRWECQCQCRVACGVDLELSAARCESCSQK